MHSLSRRRDKADGQGVKRGGREKEERGEERESESCSRDSCSPRLSFFRVVSAWHRKLNDREGALKSRACREKRVIYSGVATRTTATTFVDYGAPDALIRDGKTQPAVSRAEIQVVCSPH